jgi:hypothetical protein
LQSSKGKDTHEMTDVERVGAWIKPDVAADRSVGGNSLVEPRRHLMDEAACCEVAKELRAR